MRCMMMGRFFKSLDKKRLKGWSEIDVLVTFTSWKLHNLRTVNGSAKKTFQLASQYRYRVFFSISTHTHTHTHTDRGSESERIKCRVEKHQTGWRSKETVRYCLLWRWLNCEGWVRMFRMTSKAYLRLECSRSTWWFSYM